MNDLVNLGKFISLILRHKPELIGLKLDYHGWAKVDELLLGINNSGRFINRTLLDEIVMTNNKQRYQYNEDHTKIRANQGHSIKVDIELIEKIPPEYLYHGTAFKYLNKIEQEGIKKMKRLYVHLSKDIETRSIELNDQLLCRIKKFEDIVKKAYTIEHEIAAQKSPSLMERLFGSK